MLIKSSALPANCRRLVQRAPPCVQRQCCRLPTHACEQKSSSKAPSKPRSSVKEQKEPGLGLALVWTAAEQIGNLVGLSTPQPGSRTSVGGLTKISREDALKLIKEDYAADYFISGTGDMQAYAADCYFADPFAGFKGTDRFVKNVRNLGGMLENVKIDVYDWSEEQDSVQARWRFSSVVGVPWRPILAAGGSTTHKFDPETGLVRHAVLGHPIIVKWYAIVVEHIEAWDTEPWPVLKRLLKPSNKRPESRWEVFMLSLSQGDWPGMLFAVSDRILVPSAALVALILSLNLLFGGDWQVSVVALAEGVVFIVFAASAVAELSKLGGGLG